MLDEGTIDYLSETPIKENDILKILNINEYQLDLLKLTGLLEGSINSPESTNFYSLSNTYDLLACIIQQNIPFQKIDDHEREWIIEFLENEQCWRFTRIANYLKSLEWKIDSAEGNWCSIERYYNPPSPFEIRRQLHSLSNYLHSRLIQPTE